jgi:hypothetical protein
MRALLARNKAISRSASRPAVSVAVEGTRRDSSNSSVTAPFKAAESEGTSPPTARTTQLRLAKHLATNLQQVDPPQRQLWLQSVARQTRDLKAPLLRVVATPCQVTKRISADHRKLRFCTEPSTSSTRKASPTSPGCKKIVNSGCGSRAVSFQSTAARLAMTGHLLSPRLFWRAAMRG